ncbi:hypothetical protein FO519_007170 [Halicephalobus sp. NKZ332]|nr:hypothetical protein FO519_007170 [Halicephalobus sp. NKZ332]
MITSKKAFLIFLTFIFSSTTVLSADCESYNDCQSCAGSNQGSCKFCVTNSKCLSLVGFNCLPENIIKDSFDCPADVPSKQFAYDDHFSRYTIYPLIAATYRETPQICFDNLKLDFQVVSYTEVICDASVFNDSCAVFVAYSKTMNSVAVGFRGSQGNMETVEEVLSVFKEKKDFPPGGKVYAYFYNAFYALYNNSLLDNVQKAKTLCGNGCDQLIITGHSLGGSLASLFGTLVLHQGVYKPENLKTITMGQPRTGDEAYAKAHDELHKYSYRVVHRKDPVPHLPPKLGSDPVYHHRYEIWYNNDMDTKDDYALCLRADDDGCSNSQLDLDFNDHTHYFWMISLFVATMNRVSVAAANGDQPKLSDYQRLDKIGEGTYGVVYKGRNLQTGQMVAMKKIRLESDEEGIPSTSVREISMLIELKHPNIVDLQCVIMEEHRLYLIFEFLSMDLKKYMEKSFGSKPMPTNIVQNFLYQMLQGMHYCHQRRVIHRDLKPQNLLVDVNTKTIKLADFGLARAIGIPIRAYTHEVITLWYRAPEILLGCQRYSLGVDIWSLGCIFAEMARGRPLFCGDSEIDQLFKIFRILTTPNEQDWPGVTQFPDYKSNFPKWTDNKVKEKLGSLMNPEALDLLQQMLIYDPVNRISARACFKHPYFDNFDPKITPAAKFPMEIVDMKIAPEFP